MGVLDLGSRRQLGWTALDRLDNRWVADARTGRTAGTVFRSDRGSQYLANTHLRRTSLGN